VRFLTLRSVRWQLSVAAVKAMTSSIVSLPAQQRDLLGNPVNTVKASLRPDKRKPMKCAAGKKRMWLEENR